MKELNYKTMTSEITIAYDPTTEDAIIRQNHKLIATIPISYVFDFIVNSILYTPSKSIPTARRKYQLKHGMGVSLLSEDFKKVIQKLRN